MLFGQEPCKEHGEDNNDGGTEERMGVGAVRVEIGGRTEEHAEKIDVGDGSGDQHAGNHRPTTTRKQSTRQGVGSKSVSGDVHGQVLRGALPFAAAAYARHQQFQRPGHDRKLDRQASERLAIDLGIDGIGVERFAHQRFCLPEVDIFFLAKIAHPERRKITEIAETALRGEGHDLELVLEEIGLVGDLEGAAIILGAADDDERGFELPIAGAHAEARESVAKYFASALPPVGKDADACLQTEVHGVDNHAVRAGAGDGKKEAFAFRLLERSSQAEGDLANFAIDQAARGAGNVPGKIELFGQNVGGAAGKKRERNAMAVGRKCKAVDDFVERAVAAASDDELALLANCLLGNFCGVAGAGGFREVGVNAVRSKNLASLVDEFAPAVATVSSVGIVNQKGVLDERVHV